MKCANIFTEVEKMGINEVDVWVLKISDLLKHEKKLKSVLSNDEKQRSTAFYFVADSKRYVCAHGIMRMVLGKYTQQEPDSLTFQ